MHPNDGRVVSNFIGAALRGAPITVYGDGRQTRSFCHVDDMVEAMIRMMDSGDEVTGPINAGNPQETPVAALAELVIELTGSRPRLVFQPLPQDDPMQRCPDITKARRLLDWAPTVDLRRGLETTIGYLDARSAEHTSELQYLK